MNKIGATDYGVYNTPNGRFAFRLADHNANPNNFLQDDAKINISVYVAFREFDVPESEIEYKEYKILPEIYNKDKKKVIVSIINAVSDTLNGKDFVLDKSIAELQKHKKQNQENSSYHSLSYLDKKSLYESIMYDIAKIIKSKINQFD